MIVLGLSRAHEGGAAIIKDGKILSAINEERLNRIKNCWGFPYLSIPEAIKVAKIQPSDIDYVAVSNYSTTGEKDGQTPKIRMETDYIKKNSQLPKKAIYLISNFPSIAGSKLFSKTALGIGYVVSLPKLTECKNFLKSLNINTEISLISHHLAHASSAFLTSGFRNCFSYTSDFMGDFSSCHAYRCNEKGMEKLADISFFHSIGAVYSWITFLLGFTPGKHEGKITGLAAYGDPSKTYHIFKKVMNLSKDGLKYERNLPGYWYKNAIIKLKKDLNGFSREDIAAGVQKRYEDAISQHIHNLIKIYPEKNIALAGGSFANVKLNQSILNLPGVENVFIHPAMTDGGLAVGAALQLWAKKLWESGRSVTAQKIENVYFGNEYSEEEIKKALDTHNLKYKHSSDVPREIAKLLADSKVIARFDGRMEYGPRALGNRSILYKPTDKSVNDWLNKRLVRNEFMPFAPVTLAERIKEGYKKTKGAEHAAKFMTITFDCTPDFVKKCPAVTHVDGTARPQLITREDNPTYYDIVDEYEKITKIPTIVNTSFNMHEEPIVCTPEDAIRSFKQGHLDVLSIGNFIIKNDI